MNFKDFQRIVKEKYTSAEVFSHGEFGSRSKINVTVIFHPNGKCYSYNGTYCEVLNRLGIKAVYKHDFDGFVASLERAKRMHGQKSFFGGVIDNTAEIERLEATIKDIKENYLIV